MSSVRSALSKTNQILENTRIPDAGRDARRLVAHALGVKAGRLNLVLDEPLSDRSRTILDRAIADRLARKPVSRILGYRDFWEHRFQISGDVLDPRPETELLVELALSRPFGRVLDLGTGSGCILLSILAARSGVTGTGSDISPGALETASINRAALGLEDRAELVQSDWFSGLRGEYDLIVSNPPYIGAGEMLSLAREVTKWDPFAALCPGGTGLEAYATISDGLRGFLSPKGRALFEIGADQGAEVSRIFLSAGFGNCRVHKDLDGRDRVVELHNSP